MDELETKQYTFWGLLQKVGIKVPIIQRDYAQGRTNKQVENIRNNFVAKLFDILTTDKTIDLDFVYGTVQKGYLVPLDGQQRLTTLFLLHYYLALKDKKLNDKNKKILQKFTYETRLSSKEFIALLVEKGVNVKDNENISITITNQTWFFSEWENDPTIQGMLVMLDSIKEKFKNADDGLFEKLISEEPKQITFSFLNLDEFKLTDELYIRMNARGKPLTEFENFKVKFEQYLDNVHSNKEFKLDFDKSNSVPIQKYFAHNIDTKWADLFWQYRDLQSRSVSKEDNTFDDELMNFIRVIFTYQYGINLDLSSKNRDDSLEYLLKTQTAKKSIGYSDVISFNKYQELDAISENSAIFLIDALDALSNENTKIQNHISKDFKFYYDENVTFENALKLDFKSNHERLMFFAYVSFLIHNSNKEGIDQWMRVIHNLTHPDNTIIDSATDFARAIKSINNLLQYSVNILDYLKQNPEIDFFSKWQVLEEKIKAHLITIDDKWKKKIIEVEKHGYFNGQIGFILEFAGIVVEHYEEYQKCEWQNNKNEEYFTRFCKYANIASFVFDKSYDNRINNKDFVFERAVLTKGDYLTSASQYRYNLLSTSDVKNNIKRDHSWKRLLRVIDDEKWKEKRGFVKEVFDNIIELDEKNIVQSLSSICKDKTTNDWRDYFIKCPSLISYCNQGFIRWENEKNILLYSESQSNHYHVEMYTYYLWKKYIEPSKNNYKNVKNIYYYGVKSIDDQACIVFDDFKIGNCTYEINIYFDEKFKIAFFNEESCCFDQLNDFLLERGFEEKNDNGKYFEFEFCNDIDDLQKIMELIQNIDENLRILK